MLPAIFLCITTATSIVLWAYWPLLAIMAERWATEEEYTHGWLVPMFALLILQLRRETLRESTDALKSLNWAGIGTMAVGSIAWLAGSTHGVLTALGWVGVMVAVTGFGLWLTSIVGDTKPGTFRFSGWGLAFIILGGVMRILASYFNAEWIDAVSLLAIVAGIAVTLGGLRAWYWAWPAIGYLIFMIPLPFRVEVAMRQPLRQLSTIGSTYTLQTLGLPAYAEGNTVLINDVKLDIVAACSGLSMLMIFFALSVAVAILSDRPLWQKIPIILSAIPIAMFANICRITTQGLLHINGQDAWAETFHHDLSAWFMMGLALAILFAELAYLDRLFITELKVPMDFGLGKSRNSERGASRPAMQP